VLMAMASLSMSAESIWLQLSRNPQRKKKRGLSSCWDSYEIGGIGIHSIGIYSHPLVQRDFVWKKHKFANPPKFLWKSYNSKRPLGHLLWVDWQMNPGIWQAMLDGRPRIDAPALYGYGSRIGNKKIGKKDRLCCLLFFSSVHPHLL
jgi:hypothetical protein